ncbi:MAG: alpha/beta hydrolase [Ignavibacteria bacterium]|jgi:pimeloyl-ACP methyl ester carboxylesterase
MEADNSNNVYKINGINIFCEIIGNGEPLLMIPGLSAGTWLWSKSINSLSRKYKLIMPELRGYGRSDKPDQPYSIKMFAYDLKKLLEYFSFNRVHLMGSSMGGLIAQYFASHWADNVSSLILICTTFGGQDQIGPTGDAFLSLVKPKGKTRKERLEYSYSFLFSKFYRENHRKEFNFITNQRLRYPQPEYAYFRQFFAGNSYSGKKYAKRINAPTLICAGLDDQLVKVENAYELKENIPNSRLELFEGRHLFFYEHYKKFNGIVMDFLNDTSRKN